MGKPLIDGATPTGSGCQPTASAADASSQSGIPSAVLDEVAFAIERARCPGREGPYGGYDYGHNTDFYGPEPDGGRYVVRDFRDFRSPDWGKWVHQTACEEEHDQALLRLTGRHIAEAAITAYVNTVAQRQTSTLIPNALHEAIGNLVSHCADHRDIYPDAATALEVITDAVNLLYACIDDGVFGPIAQGIEAATADETRSGSAVGESPVSEGNAPDNKEFRP